MISVATTDVELLSLVNLPPTFYCYGTRDPFYDQFIANANASRKTGVLVKELELKNMPHGYGVNGNWISTYDKWLEDIFNQV